MKILSDLATPRLGVRLRRFVFRSCFVLPLALTSCASGGGGTPRLLSPDGMAEPGWSIEDRQLNIATREVRSTESETLVWVRAKGSEKPHYHDRTDMTVFVVSGRVLMHIDQRAVDAKAGDVIDIPRGTLHWVENKSSDASVAFVVFSPSYDGRDHRLER